MINAHELCDFLRYLWREEHNINKLAKQVGISQSYLYDILTAKKDKKMSIGTISQIAKAVGYQTTSRFISDAELYTKDPGSFTHKRLKRTFAPFMNQRRDQKKVLEGNGMNKKKFAQMLMSLIKNPPTDEELQGFLQTECSNGLLGGMPGETDEDILQNLGAESTHCDRETRS